MADLEVQYPNLFCDFHRRGLKLSEAVSEFKAAYVRFVLAQNNGHVGKTATELDTHRNTIGRHREVAEPVTA